MEFYLQPLTTWSFPFSKIFYQFAFSQFFIHHVLLAFVTIFCLTMNISYNDFDIFLVPRQVSSATVTKRKVIMLVCHSLPCANSWFSSTNCVRVCRKATFSHFFPFLQPASFSSLGRCNLMFQKVEGSMMKVLISHLSIYVAKEEWISRIQPHESADLHFIPPFCFIFRFLNTLPLGAYF